MRKTVTLDLDVRALLDLEMRTKGITLRQALNDAIRNALGTPKPPFRQESLAMAGEMDDEEILRKIELGK